jgi:hypothetical protein
VTPRVRPLWSYMLADSASIFAGAIAAAVCIDRIDWRSPADVLFWPVLAAAAAVTAVAACELWPWRT